MSSSVDEVVEAIFALYAKHGREPYIGENVSQMQHAQQAAALARKDGCSDHVVLGAFLHDVGHLVGLERGLPRMKLDGGDDVDIGIENHEGVGEDYLRSVGMPETVTAIVRGHVEAKRYLTGKHPSYQFALSSASRMTLIAQGGPMTEQEVHYFERRPDFKTMIRMREWDDQAKEDIPADPEMTERMKKLCREVLAEARG